LEVWSLEHREAQHSQDSLDVLAAKYTHDLIEERVCLAELSSACAKASRRWSFFPKMADMLKAVDEHRQRPPERRYNQEQLDDTTSNHDLTPEEIDRNKERMKHITDMLAGKLSMNEAIEAVGKSNHIQEFGNK